MRIVQDSLWFCTDCTAVECNGVEGLDITPEQLKDTLAGLKELGMHLAPNFDSETGEGIEDWSTDPCDACHSELAGYRARFALLAE